MSSALAPAHRVASKQRLPRSALVACALLVPVFALRVGSVVAADHWASKIATQLLALAATNRAPEEPEPTEPLVAAQASPEEIAGPRRAARDGTHTRQGGRSHGSSVQHGIRVTAAQVLALAARRAMPQAVPVKANAQHPAGLLLRGVASLGIGLQEGDVLTEAAGQKASSVAVVVGVVLAARGRQVPEISGRFFRAGVPFGLTVEQPYPKSPLPG